MVWEHRLGEEEKKQDMNPQPGNRNHFYVVLVSPVGNVEASQVVGSITEEVQQSEARLRHHLRNCLVPITLRNNQTTVTQPNIRLLWHVSTSLSQYRGSVIVTFSLLSFPEFYPPQWNHFIVIGCFSSKTGTVTIYLLYPLYVLHQTKCLIHSEHTWKQRVGERRWSLRHTRRGGPSCTRWQSGWTVIGGWCWAWKRTDTDQEI